MPRLIVFTFLYYYIYEYRDQTIYKYTYKITGTKINIKIDAKGLLLWDYHMTPCTRLPVSTNLVN